MQNQISQSQSLAGLCMVKVKWAFKRLQSVIRRVYQSWTNIGPLVQHFNVDAAIMCYLYESPLQAFRFMWTYSSKFPFDILISSPWFWGIITSESGSLKSSRHPSFGIYITRNRRQTHEAYGPIVPQAFEEHAGASSLVLLSHFVSPGTFSQKSSHAVFLKVLIKLMLFFLNSKDDAENITALSL